MPVGRGRSFDRKRKSKGNGTCTLMVAVAVGVVMTYLGSHTAARRAQEVLPFCGIRGSLLAVHEA